MRSTVLRILGLLILIVNVGFSEYIIENGKIYYNEDYHKTLVIKRIDDEKSEKYLTKNPDLKSFKILNENFAKDKDSVKILSKNYYKDRNNVYCNDKVLKGADVKTFELVGNDKDEAMDEFIDTLENIFDDSGSLEKSNETKKSSITAQDKNHKYEYCRTVK